MKSASILIILFTIFCLTASPFAVQSLAQVSNKSADQQSSQPKVDVNPTNNFIWLALALGIVGIVVISLLVRKLNEKRYDTIEMLKEEYASKMQELEHQLDEAKRAPSTLTEQDYATVIRQRKVKNQKEFERNLQKTILLRKLIARNFDIYEDFDWAFQPQINLFLGKNGYGKSHLLRALAAMLQNDDEKAPEFFSSRASQSKLSLAATRAGKNELIEYSSSRFASSLGKAPLLAIPDSRFINKSKTKVSLPEVGDDQCDLPEDGAFHFLNQLPYESMIQTFLYQLCIDYLKAGESFDLPIFNLARRIIRELTDSQFDFSRIEDLGNARFRIEVFTEGNEKNALPIQKASQGTLSVLAVFGLIHNFLKSMYPDAGNDLHAKPAIVIIDEADAHLHPSWQQKLVGLFRGNFPNVQFILTAHSPLVAAGCFENEVAVLKKEKGRRLTLKQHPGNLIGVSAIEILNDLFETEDEDETFSHFAGEIALKKDVRRQQEINQKRVNDLEIKSDLTPEEEKELAELYNYNRYTAQVEAQMNEQENQDQEIKIAELEAKVRELEYRLEQRSTIE